MTNNSRKTILAVALAACTTLIAQAQSNSAIEFYDPTGTAVTSKFGWLGGAADGYFFIETPDDGDGFKLQKGSLTLGGIITATKFVGDGSGLTGLSLPAELDPTVPPGLKDGISWSEIQDIPAGFADGVDNVATGGTGNTGENASAQEVAAMLKGDATFQALVKGDTGPKGDPGDKGKDGTTPDMSLYALKTDIQSIPDMTVYALKTEIPTIPDMTAYALKTEIPIIPDLTIYALKKDIPNLSIYAKTTDLPDLTKYALKTDLHEYARLEGANFKGGILINGPFQVYNDELNDCYISHNLEVDKKLTVNGGCTGCTAAPSDRRFKRNIEKIESPLQIIKKIEGVRFNWKKEEFPEKHFPEKRELGVIAQDVKEAVPEAVNQDKDGHYLVDYPKLVPLLIEAVKEQQTTIQILKGKLAEQTKNFNDRLSAIENRL